MATLTGAITFVEKRRRRAELKPGVARRVGEVKLSVLERQALSGALGVGKKGAPVTLHSGHLADIWRSAIVGEDGSITFTHPLAHVLDAYDATTLRPEWQAVFETEIQPILDEGIDLIEE